MSLIPNLIRFIVRPIVGFCLRRQVPIQDLYEILKEEYVREAKNQLEASSERVTTSRLSLITGIHRRDIDRLQTTPETTKFQDTVLIRVVALWQHASQFQTSRHEPRVLTSGFVGSEFHALVAAAHREFNPATILSELIRAGIVSRTTRGVKLELQSYSPRGDPQRGFSILSKDINDIVSVVERNVFATEKTSTLHVRTEYDRVRASAVPEIDAWVLKEGHEFHRKVREFIGQFDLDTTGDLNSNEPVVRVVVGSFGLAEGNESISLAKKEK